jgi:hypothetical protein
MLSLGLWFPTENIDESSATRNFFFVHVAMARDERIAERQEMLSDDIDVRALIDIDVHAVSAFAELPRPQCLYTASLTPRGAS